MKNILAFFCPFLILISSFIYPGDTEEALRQKVELMAYGKVKCLGELIHTAPSLSGYYQKQGFNIYWSPEMHRQLLKSLKASKDEGLNPNDYHFEKLNFYSKNPPENIQEKIELELLLSDAFLLYASHILSGKVNPETTDAEWHVARREGDPVQALESVITTKNVENVVRSLLPEHEVYKSLKKALKSYRSLEAQDWPVIPEGVTIKKGMTDDRLLLIRQRLNLLGDLTEKNTQNPEIYDEKLEEAIKSFQKRHGLDSEGNIGAKTISALNISVEQRINQVEANMERWRWLPREFGDYYIKVNIANFELDVVKQGAIVRNHKIIAGKPYRKTPVFSSKMQYLVFNPTWTIPPGILNADILPAVRKDISYLNKKKLVVYDAKGTPVDPSAVDWNSKEVKSYTYRQPAGPENALGAVKFMFPNKFHVYLHDTPSKELFEKSERAFSSGCIRVHNPLSLAEYLLQDSEKWSRERIDKLITSNKTETVWLKEQPNIYLLYWTAWTGSDGLVQFRNDIYDRDKLLIKELNEKYPS